jgi:cell division transport system permease protein
MTTAATEKSGAGKAPEKRATAERSRRGPGSALRAWRDLHLYSLVSSLGRIAARPWATALTIGVMAIALALPLGLWLALANVERFSGSARESREIGAFLVPGIEAAKANALVAELRGREDVAAIALRTPEQGLAEFREMADLAGALDVLEHNPLPFVLVIDPAGDGHALAEALRGREDVEVVQHDAAWRERLDGWLGFGERVVQVVALLLGLGALLVVGNTVRLDIQSRSEEIGVLQLLGATDGFVRRPFLYLGAWYGLGAGLLALLTLAVAGYSLQAPLSQLIASYGSTFGLHGPGWLGAMQVLAAATALGWLGAWLATGHHLRATRPTEL